MLSLRELRRVARVLDREFAGSVVERWVQPDGERLSLLVFGRDASGAGAKRCLLLSTGERSGRASELARPPAALPEPPGLCAYLRAHLGRARFVSAGILGEDRQLALRFRAREGEYDLLLSLLGRRSNIYLLAADGKLLSALRPLRETREELDLGELFTSPTRSLALEGEDRFEAVADDELLVAIETHYAQDDGAHETDDLARMLQKGLRKERKNAERRLERVEAELAEAEQTTVLKRQGDLLKTALSRIAPGADGVTVRDYETGEDVLVPLDPKLSPKQNLEATFKRYHKLVRRLTKAGGQLDTARGWRDEVVSLEERCQELGAKGSEEAAAELAAIAARPAIARLLARSGPKVQGKTQAQVERERKSALPPLLRELPSRLVPRRYLTADELEVWVGRSDEANDHLSLRLARGKDLFFHVDGSPGSHVILRTEGRQDPPPESVLDACELAVHFSKLKNASRADLHVVPIKNVSKPRGAKPGLVYVTGGRSVHLRRDDARLARVLASRIDE